MIFNETAVHLSRNKTFRSASRIVESFAFVRSANPHGWFKISIFYVQLQTKNWKDNLSEA